MELTKQQKAKARRVLQYCDIATESPLIISVTQTHMVRLRHSGCTPEAWYYETDTPRVAEELATAIYLYSVAYLDKKIKSGKWKKTPEWQFEGFEEPK